MLSCTECALKHMMNAKTYLTEAIKFGFDEIPLSYVTRVDKIIDRLAREMAEEECPTCTIPVREKGSENKNMKTLNILRLPIHRSSMTRDEMLNILYGIVGAEVVCWLVDSHDRVVFDKVLLSDLVKGLGGLLVLYESYKGKVPAKWDLAATVFALELLVEELKKRILPMIKLSEPVALEYYPSLQPITEEEKKPFAGVTFS
ncbi:MAG: hypothetical protein DSO07_03000 [Thermoproteota archaeon]|nr:MAG: hypothetical protein DSO07_03000 [Candidatus Korarchaeota archaeon]